MIAKVHNTPNDIILAVCDTELLGKKIKTKETIVEISDFYKGEEVSNEELVSLVRKATIINAMGKETIKFLLDNEITSEDKIMKVGRVPHVQIFKMK